MLRKAPRDTGKGFYTAIRVEEVRTLIGDARLTRGRAGFRVTIVDAIDDCNPSSANALLKILEEPPAETLFILISHRPGGLLPTIRSRCRSIALRPLSDAEVRDVVRRAAAGWTPPLRWPAAGRGARSRLWRWARTLASRPCRAGSDPPAMAPLQVHLSIADALAADKAGAAFAFGKEMLTDWIAAEARSLRKPAPKARLASAEALWDKATALFADAEEYNLDARQTLISLFDAIRGHAQTHLLVPAQ